MSDKIINKDLLRFYKPKGYTQIIPNDYQYLGPKNPKPHVTTTGGN
jgi:lipoteichoic acid synthase